MAKIRQLLETLRARFGIRLFEAIGGSGPITLMTDGREIYARTAVGEFYDVLRAPDQPLLVVGSNLPMREINANTKRKRRKGTRTVKPRQTST